MIDEEVLANLITEHATRIPVPDAGVDALLARSPEVERRTIAHRMPRPSARVLAGAAAFCLVAAGCVAFVRSGGSPSNGTRGATASAPFTSPAAAPPTTMAPAPVGAGSFPVTHGAANVPPSARELDKGTPPSSDAVTAPTDTARVIRTATVDLRIARHSFGTVVSRVTTVAASEGGFIADANTNEAAATPSGTMTVRVPSARFNDTIGRLRVLGKVESQTTRGSDVTGQYTDLQARLNAATATRNAYLAILDRATNIGDVLAVQDRIEGVQTQIDQFQGQINALDNQTTYATITLSASEPPPKPKPAPTQHKPSGLQSAWDNARNGFSRRIESLISHSGSALVILLFLAAVAFLLRLLVPRARRLFV